ncbi:CalY family protein [Cytobacillus spongiae]|jgi:hypothetical protein|uniref:CalY family protein n=1 Tax=Cytobacillus spongiae TaxID=2901381 RepID=UPI001F2FD05E|nr:CalY family protein [Cytobacillus spongiae]UII56514.1 CalY family protein [Cytobacillus spongiae]
MNIRPLAKPLLIFLLVITYSLFPILVLADEAKDEMEITIQSNGIEYMIHNIKPGDWMPREITIVNDGNKDFSYTTVIENSKSVKGLFEQLDFLVLSGSKVLYEGKVKEFKGVTPRNLAKGQKETLMFQVTMPYELGNSYQGSQAEFVLKFYAEEIDSVTTPEAPNDDPPNPTDDDILVTPVMKDKLPNTATNTFNFLLTSVVFLSAGGALLLIYYRKTKIDAS